MNHSKNTVLKTDLFEDGQEKAPIIPWPKGFAAENPLQKSRVRLDQKFLYYNGRKIPILQFQKAGYEKLLKLLVKEMSR